MSSVQNRKTPTGRSRLERLFLRCADLPRAEWEQVLAVECVDDPALAQQVRRLLEAEEQSGEWSSPVWQTRPLRFGQYRVSGRIGAGGMGVVYEAIRDDAEFDKKVAVKAIPPGLITENGARLLRQERQILAHLEHPNIARLLDGGTSEDGVPYLVMELVEGIPLLEFARRETLGEAARLRLFLAICEGIGYAHRNLIVHRDLKPANILVTPEGIPKILDFGIARLLDMQAEITVLGERAMTFEYASPEQISGLRMTTESDIYSLGLLLVVLLTGNPPARRQTQEIELPGGLSKDVTSILVKALQAEPERRYRSVEALADDVRNYLDGRPITARPQTVFYRLNRWIRRNKVVAGAALTAVAAIGVGIQMRLEALHRAERRFNQVRKLADSLVYELSDAVESVPGTLEARRLIGKRAVEYLDSLALEAGNETSLKSDVAAAYAKVGPLAFDVRKELALDAKAVGLLREVIAAEPENLKYRRQFAEALNLLANSYRRAGEYERALAAYREEVAVCETTAHRHQSNQSPSNRGALEDLATAYAETAVLLRELGTFEEAFSFFRKGPPILEELIRSHGDHPQFRFLQLVSLSFLARAYSEREEPAQAMAAVRQAMEINAKLMSADPANRNYIRTQWVLFLIRSRARLLTGDVPGALKDLRQALPITEQLSSKDPADTGYRRGIAITCLALADVLVRQKKPAKAERLYRRAIETSEALYTGDPKHVETTIDLLEMYSKAANLALARKDLRTAAADVHRGLELLEQRKPLPPQFFLQTNIADLYLTAGKAELLRKESARPAAYFQQSLSIWEQLRSSGRWLPKYAANEAAAKESLAAVSASSSK